MSLLLLCLLGLAEPQLAVPVGDRAVVTEMPPVAPRVTELILRGVEGDIQPLQDRRTPGIKTIDVSYRGEGSWILRAEALRDTDRVQAEVRDGRLLLSVGAATSAPLPVPDALSLDALLAGGLPGAVPDPIPAMSFLHGEALSLRLSPADVPLTRPGWLEGATRDDLDAARKALLAAQQCGRSCAIDEAAALYELGWRYVDQGWGREGFHYLERLSTRPGAVDPALVTLAQARAALSTRRYDLARERLAQAAAAGAPEQDLVEGLAVVSLATGSPARSATARTLTATTADPHMRLLAAELLQLDGRFAESVPHLQAAAAAGIDPQRVALRLGDAALVAGDIDTARQYWQGAPETLASFRAIVGELHRLTPASWAAAVPQLRPLIGLGGDVGAEALYLVARIDRELGIDVDAIESLTRFLDTHPRRAEGSDAPALLWELYADRAHRLGKEEAWRRLAALHESAWRPVLRDEITDGGQALWTVARAYEALGLTERAVEVLALGLEVGIAAGAPDPNMTLHLARLYEQTGSCQDGLNTLRYLREHGAGVDTPAVSLMTGRMLMSCEQDAQAAAYLRRATKSPETRAEAQVRLAVLDAQAGRCAAAVAPLKEHLMGGDGDWSTPDAGLSLTRCLADLGRLEEAAAAADALLAHTDDPQLQRYVRYLATLYRDDPGALTPGEDIWGAVSADREESAALDALIDQRRR